MWENFKKKVTNFIYEEIEEEIEEQPEIEEHESAQIPDRGRDRSQHDVKTRMTFEYPKKGSSEFRFPVIPDEKEVKERPIPPEPKQRVGHFTETTKPAFIRRKQRPRRAMNQRTDMSSRSIYEQKKLAEELENIPAYKRRRRERIEDDYKIETIEEQATDSFAKEDQTERDSIPYSKPDELDAVFARKKSARRDFVEEKSSLIPSGLMKSRETHHEKIGPKANTNEKTQHDTLTNINKGEIDNAPIMTNKYGVQDTLSHEAVTHNQNPVSGESKILRHSQTGDEVAATISASQVKAQPEVHQVEPTEVAEETVQLIDLPHYLLDDVATEKPSNRDWLRDQKQMLEQTLEHFNIDAQIVAVTQGPTVTRIEIQPALGVKVSRIRNLADDIKLNLAARDIRIEAPIPGKHTVGIEIPNESPQVVHLQEMMESETFQQAGSPLTVALGLTIEGEPYFTDISNMPHGLIAGATGSGKSVCINTVILSLLYKAHFNEVKLMLIDPKMVELTQYNGIPHLLTPVITDAKAATVALKWAVDEMERRYELFVEHQVRNIKRYNRKQPIDKLPYIVIIIDELADLMLVSPQEVEDYISRIAQKARAAGIHLLLATQRPSVDVITGLIKANIPSRIAFAVSSQVDSRTILDANGAEKLLGKGDMLFIENGINKQLRLQGPFVSDDEIDRVVHYLRSVAEPDYLFEHDELFLQLENEEEDELFADVVEYVLQEEKASTSMLQRRFRIGYNRAARLIDAMHDQGIISSQNGSRPRDVLITKAQWEHNQ